MALPNPILSQTEDGLLPLNIRIFEALEEGLRKIRKSIWTSDKNSSSQSTGVWI
jgi:hypothetical protein